MGDVVFGTIEYDDKANFVIERVFEQGDVDDMRNCRRYINEHTFAEESILQQPEGLIWQVLRSVWKIKNKIYA